MSLDIQCDNRNDIMFQPWGGGILDWVSSSLDFQVKTGENILFCEYLTPSFRTG